MKLFGLDIRREQRASAEDPRVPISAESFMAFLGIQSANLPSVTLDSALTVPAFAAAVSFLPNTLANLPLHAYRKKDDGSDRIKGGLQRIVNEAPNAEWTSFGLRKYFWTQVFTGGRGLAWIERSGTNIVGIWPMEPTKTTVKRINGKKVYEFTDGGTKKVYPAADVIDVPFMLKGDQLASYSPLVIGGKAIGLALAMGDYAANFFAGGGVPPLALSGPLPAGPEALKRAQGDIRRAIDLAKASSETFIPIPAGFELKPVGFDPGKGQMTEARRLQIEEIARIFNLPPVFLQDLTHGTFSNTEQQDLQLTKHLISQWAKALEEELNLKLFGPKNGGRYVEHSLDGLLRGDFKTRMEGLARGIQTAILTPNEARALENRPAHVNGDDLMIQGATVPLGSQPTEPTTPAQPEADDGETDNDQP